MKRARAPLSFFITGIAGFIGFHLASFLKKRGDYVIGCDNFNDYYSPELKKNRSALLAKQGIEVLSCDLCDIVTLSPLFEKYQFTHCIHLAAQAGVRYSLTHPHAYRHSNLDGTLYLLEMCRNFKPLALIFASSSSVYGNTTLRPLKEDDPTDAPISLYAATKKAGELLAKSYHHLYNIPTTILRFFTCYGPWGRPDMAYFSFASAILRGEPIKLYHRGELQRDFTYIDDTVQGIASAIDHCKEGYNVYNLGSAVSVSVRELLSYLETALGKRAIILQRPMQPGDVTMTWAAIDKAKEELGFKPKIALQEGIKRFAHWYLSFQNTQRDLQTTFKVEK